MMLVFLLALAQLCPCGTGTQADPLIAMSGDPAQIARDVHASAVFYGRTDDDYWIGLSGHVGGPSSDGRYWLGWNRYWESRMDPTSNGSADPGLAALPALHRAGQATPTPTPTATPAPIALATCADIEGFYEKYLGREPAADDCANWLDGAYGATSKSDVEAQIANSEEARQHAAQPSPEPTATPAPTPSPTPTPEPTASPTPTPAPSPISPVTNWKTFFSYLLGAVIVAIVAAAKLAG